jgi:hypothetical protein
MATREDSVECKNSEPAPLSSGRKVEEPPDIGTTRNGHVRLPIRVLGSDVQGRHFDETGRTSSISWNGGAIVLGRKLEIDQELIIRRLDSNKEADIRVVELAGKEGDEFVYEVSFLNPASNLWDLQPPIDPGHQTRSQNRRKRHRIPTRASAGIREMGLPEEIVVCENLSRGGLSFRSRKHYLRGSRIEIALPYSPGSGNIFVPARIVRVERLQGLFRYGAAYISPPETKEASDAS